MMTPEECMYDLQWNPMMLGETKQERYEKARRERVKHQKHREEQVLFMQSFIFSACMFFIGCGLVIIGGLGGKF